MPIGNNTDEQKKFLEKNWIFETIPGKAHPDRWPEGLDEMIERLSQLEFLSLFHEDHLLYEDILSKLYEFTKNMIPLLKSNSSEKAVESIKKGMTAQLLFAFAFGNFVYWVCLP